MLKAISNALKILRPADVRLARAFCPLCDRERFFVRLVDNEIGVRCLSCRATPVTLSLIDVLLDVTSGLESQQIYELSCRGALFSYLKVRRLSVCCSEYFADVAPGEYKDGTQCQDVQCLTFSDDQFDICTSTEVFEHVPDDQEGFAEVSRVLKPDGVCVFSVPIRIRRTTTERAVLMAQGGVRHLLPPEYHGDPLSKGDGILAFRDYGYDILERLVACGFRRAEIRWPRHRLPWGHARPIVVAFNGEAPQSDPGSDPFLIRRVSQ